MRTDHSNVYISLSDCFNVSLLSLACFRNMFSQITLPTSTVRTMGTAKGLLTRMGHQMTGKNVLACC